MLIAQRPLAHICKFNRSLRAGVHKPIAAGGVEFGGGDDFRELFHIRGFYIDNVEALVLNVEIPQINPKVVTADERLPIAIHGDAVYVVCVGVGIRLSGYSGHDGIMMCHSGKLQHRGILERRARGPRGTSSTNRTGWSKLV